MYRERSSGLATAGRICFALGMGLFLVGYWLSSGNAGERTDRSVPVIYCSDLFHPPDDPDDWFDLATVFSIDEFDIRGIVLDQGEKQFRKPGRIPIEQMMAITGKRVRFACGLAKKLKSPSDKGLDEAERFQGGVNLILNVLRKSEGKVTIITVGSLRDVCAAFNRAPRLLKAKVKRLYISAGNSGGGNEYNVQLDPEAYVGVMRSGLPIYWLPCFGKEPFVSRWAFRQGELFDIWSVKVQNYFAYGLTKADPMKRDPVVALEKPIPEEVKTKVWGMKRSMWSTPGFIDAAGGAVAVERGGGWRTMRGAKTKLARRVFRFVPAKVTVRDRGITHYADIEVGSSEPNMHIFRFEGKLSDYNEAMKECLGVLLRKLGR